MNDIFLAIDVGGTKTMLTVYSENLKLLSSKKVPSDVSSQENELQIIYKLLDLYLIQSKYNIKAITVDTVGRVNHKKGIWYGINNNIGHEINLVDMISSKYDLPCFAINDVYAAAYAEAKFGIGNKFPNFIYINVGTGIAGRSVENGRVSDGVNSYAGEYGHMVVDMQSTILCTCGRYGCVESFASGLGMSNMAIYMMDNDNKTELAIEKDGRISVQQLIEKYPSDKVAQSVIDNAIKGLSILIRNLLRENDPNAIILGGGVFNNTYFFNMLLSQLDKTKVTSVQYVIGRTNLNPNLVASLGAACFAKDNISL